jgi:antitoxin HicB
MASLRLCSTVGHFGGRNYQICSNLEDSMKYRIQIQQDEDGVFVVEVPSLPGCISQGTTRSEAIENIKEAIQLYLESLEAHGDPVPPPITEDIVEV